MPTYTYMQAERPQTPLAAPVQTEAKPMPLISERAGRYIEYALATMTGLAGLFFVYELFVYFSYTR